MPWNLLILPLIGGYFILSRSNKYKFKQQRLDRQRLIFDSIFAAIILLLGTVLLRLIINYCLPEFIPIAKELIPIKTAYIGTAFSAFFAAIIFTYGGNRTLYKNIKIEVGAAIDEVGNELELLLKSSATDSKLLEFTLDNDKVYIAWVKELPIPTISNSTRVIPVLSGYRNEEKRIVFTTHYLSVYAEYVEEGKIKDINELDVDLIISLSKVSHVSYFDVDMYERFNPEES